MQLKDAIESSLQSILSHKLRSSLTLIGIMIGVAAVITMFSSVYGIKMMINDNIEGMGWNDSVIISPSSSGSNQRRRFHGFMRMQRKSKGIRYSDYKYLKDNVEHKYSYGVIEQWTSYIFGDKLDRTGLKATNNDFFYTKSYYLKEGRLFNQFDLKNREKVCIVGYYFAKDKVKDFDIIGKKITIGNQRYKIIGILDDDQLNNGNFDFNPWQRRRELHQVYIPLSTGTKYLTQNKTINFLYFQSKEHDSFNEMKNKLRQNMLMLHRMAHDFSFSDIGAKMLEITSELNDMMKKWNITLTAIATVSLIVGGIGLFSTLLISINERMTEIGVRKSIGATEGNIFGYFIMEALTLAIIAAMAGIITSLLLMLMISKITSIDFPIPVIGIFIGTGFSIIIGFLSGVYPAIKASKIDPIKAIFYFE